MCLLADVPMSSNSGSISDNDAIIGGAVGGAVGGVTLLLMIIAVLCVMILSMRRSRGTATNHVNDKVSNNKFNLSNSIVSNNMDNVTEANTMDTSYSTVKPEKCSSRETSNQSNYAQPNHFNDQQSELDETIRVANDPAYAGQMNKEVDPACGANTGDMKTATDPAYAGNTKLDNDLTCEVSTYTVKDKETALNRTATISAANEHGIITQLQSDDPNSDAAKQIEANYGVVNQPQS